MIKDEALKLSSGQEQETFVKWLYDRGYIIVTPDELDKINGMTVLAHAHGMNPFNEQNG
jgi:hypothetical protein